MSSQNSPDTHLRASRALQQLDTLYSPSRRSTSPTYRFPLTSPARLSSDDKAGTVLYLAYGSNLSAETFRGVRGICPLSAVNVHTPSLTLTFDLAGLPYKEPCFANTRYRASPTYEPPAHEQDYHKTRWSKGLVGVVYEVTLSDYATIIATEGGGAGYQDVTVPCFPLPAGLVTMPSTPQGVPFIAHTLFSPADTGDARWITRPCPNYAQPSPRYMKLITDGAEEHALPADYLAYLYGIRAYRITTHRQRVGQVLFLGFWAPLLWLVNTLGLALADGEGRVPEWFAGVVGVFFQAMWGCYDMYFKRIWGDGERAITDAEDDVQSSLEWEEKGLLH